MIHSSLKFAKYLKKFAQYLMLAGPLICCSLTASAEPMFDFNQSTPVGSWQVREETTTDHKGKQSLAVMKTSLLSKVEYQGTPHYWIEMEMQTYKLKKNDRKPQGKPMILKALVDASVASGDAANVIGNLDKYGREVIFQSGNDDPVRIQQSGMLGKSMLQAMGTKIEYQFTKTGETSVAVPAGKIKCTSYKGTGSTEIDLIIKKIRVNSETQACISDTVPFGIVNSVSTSTNNGKESTSEAVLVEYGTSGAVSAITKEPTSTL